MFASIRNYISIFKDIRATNRQIKVEKALEFELRQKRNKEMDLKQYYREMLYGRNGKWGDL